MRILQAKKLYLPALSIVAVVVILLVLIGVSTYRNLDREEKRALEFLHWEGFALMQSLEAAIRVGMVLPTWSEATLRSLLEESAKNTDIVYLFLVGRDGTVLYHSDSYRERKHSHWVPQFDEGDEVVSRVEHLSDGSRVYELARDFPALAAEFRVPGYEGLHRSGTPPGAADAVLVLGLQMTAFEQARRSDLHHALVMSAILVALGSGALFFIFVIQNYYLVDRTLKETQDYTAQVVASMANGLLSVDQGGRVLSYNRPALEFLGLQEAEVRMLDLRRVLDFAESGIQSTLDRSEVVLEREIMHRTPRGEVIPLALNVTPIRAEDGRCKSAVMVLRDLREIKRLEDEVRRTERLAAVGELAAGVAHEIRNPLSSIRGLAHILRHSLAGSPKERDYAEIVVKEVDRINRVVTNLLTFARPLESEPALTDPRELVEHTVRLVQADADRKRIEIQTTVDPNLPEVVMDEHQMIQALLNLTLNSLQALETEGGKIEVGARVIDGGARILHFWVEDDGPGIPPGSMAKIFDPFFTTRAKGTGLGLAIVRNIVEHHHGEVTVESPPAGKARGSRLTISIPVDAKPSAGRGQVELES
jgi:two-component system sensor histidine kinase HydH